MNMKQAQISLKLFLDVLDIPSKISTLADRKRVQKAVYIGQMAGADLGYSYGWYLLGPYSPELTQDYFALNNDLINEDDDYTNYELNKSLSEKLYGIKNLMNIPERVNLSQEDWLELVASIVYNRKTRNDTDTKDFLMLTKSNLMVYYEIALSCAKKHNLISH